MCLCVLYGELDFYQIGGRKASSMCSMRKGGSLPTTVMTSKRTGRSSLNFLIYESASDTNVRILRLVMASSGCPYASHNIQFVPSSPPVPVPDVIASFGKIVCRFVFAFFPKLVMFCHIVLFLCKGMKKTNCSNRMANDSKDKKRKGLIFCTFGKKFGIFAL